MDEDFFSAFEDTPQVSRPSVPRPQDSENTLAAEDLVASILGSDEVGTQPDEEKTQPAIKKRKVVKAHADDDDNPEVDDLDAIKLIESAPKITIHTLQTPDSCTHEVAVPPGQEFLGLKANSQDPARTFPFELDAFQKQAILCIENYQSILVSAHTSAGKTVPAEYAIALSLREKQRVIYTTPIKALSNQKFREFEEKFKDVGIITGDVTLNPGASCLIMTTEILRSMLYRGSEITREVGWVIFDEIHYMRDKERGVVWEESLILLPDNVHYVFLSATIPNARQFAEWIAHLHKQPCHVVYTDYRPTPLTHYIFPAGGNGVHLVVDGDGNFREDNFSDAMAVIANNGGEKKSGGGNQKSGKDMRRSGGTGGGGGGESDCFRLVKLIMENDWAPAIVFSFSKKECEAYALQMSKLDFNTPVEKQLVDTVYQNAIDKLSPEDRTLPQVENVLPLLKRGIGIHHGGLLPILKELVEILFAESLIKVLFATETFAMGLNMPARTVLFTSARKFDGTDTRWISSGEYIQMSGRAGRRGLDASGIVILMLDEKTVPSLLRNIVKGSADPINSAFRLTYNMVLNLLRVEEVNPEYIMERSFVQFQNYSNIPKLYQDVKKLEADISKIIVPEEAEVESYYRLREQLSHLAEEFRGWLIKPQYLIPFLQPGRLVRVRQQDKDFGFGVIINFKKKPVKERDNPMETEGLIVVDVMMFVTVETAKSKSPLSLMPGDFKVPASGVMEIVPIDSGLIQQISSVKLYIPSDLRSGDNRKAVFKSLQQVYKRFSDKVPLLDPVKDMKISDKSFKTIVEKINTFETRLEAHPVHSKPDLAEILEAYKRKDCLLKELEGSKSRLNKAKSLIQMADLNKMKRVLRRLKYCTESDVIEVKGRIACELSSADELLLTEMIFNGLFNSLSAEQCASILSCFVSDEKSNEMPKLTEELSGPLRTMQEMARKIAQTSMEAKIDLKVDDYVSKFKPFMMDVVFEWCKGQPFVNICKMTDLFEGSIIRSLRRLEELLRQMVQASKNIGNAELENKFSEAIKLLKRDIVFAASLYL